MNDLLLYNTQQTDHSLFNMAWSSHTTVIICDLPIQEAQTPKILGLREETLSLITYNYINGGNTIYRIILFAFLSIIQNFFLVKINCFFENNLGKNFVFQLETFLTDSVSERYLILLTNYMTDRKYGQSRRNKLETKIRLNTSFQD